MEENEITSDDKLFAALAYFFSPLSPILILLVEDKKNRPFIRAHNVQALVTGVVFWIFFVVFSVITCGIGTVSSVAWLIMLYWSYKAYTGEYVQIPVITDFVKNQGWA